MTFFLIDFVVMAVLVIGSTALLGVISTSIGRRVFGRKNSHRFESQNMNSQKGWRKMTRE